MHLAKENIISMYKYLLEMESNRSCTDMSGTCPYYLHIYVNRRACMRDVMNIEEADEKCQDRSKIK